MLLFPNASVSCQNKELHADNKMLFCSPSDDELSNEKFLKVRGATAKPLCLLIATA